MGKIKAGKAAASPLQPPLRTVRASFPAYGSSIPEATRKCDRRCRICRLRVALPKFSRRSGGRRHRERCSLMLPSMESFDGFTLEHRTEVCSLSREVMLQPLSEPLRPGIRFFRLLIPAQSTTRLAVRLPRGRPYGLATFPLHHTTGLGPVFSPVDLADDVLRTVSGATVHAPFWLMPISSFGTLHMTTFINGSHSLSLPVSHASRPPSLLGASICRLTTAHAFGLRTSEGLHQKPLPASDAFLGYRWSYSGFSIASATASEQ